MHPNEGDLRSYLDGELPEEDRSSVADHLRECSICRERRDDLDGLDVRLREALQRLPVPPARTAHARNAVRTRLSGVSRTSAPDPSRNGRGASAPEGIADPTRRRNRRRRDRRSGTGRERVWMRAAGFVLLLVGGIAAGLPGSPVREWIGSIGRDAAPVAPTTESAASAEGSAARSEAGVRLAPTGDSAHVSLVGAAPGTRVRVHLIEGDVLEVSAAAGTRFRTGAARVEVLDAASAVTVRVPRELGRAVVEADGRTLVRKRDEETTLPTLQAETVDGGIVFTLPAAADPRSP